MCVYMCVYMCVCVCFRVCVLGGEGGQHGVGGGAVPVTGVPLGTTKDEKETIAAAVCRQLNIAAVSAYPLNTPANSFGRKRGTLPRAKYRPSCPLGAIAYVYS
jgi:hypothetical protein